MTESAWRDGYWRDARWLVICLATILIVTFSPFIVGPFSLLTSASDAPSLYASGAVRAQPSAAPVKEADPGGADWQSEAWLRFEHDALFVAHRAPWWDPYDGYGQPFAAAQASQPFFPLTLAAAVAPSPRMWNVYIVARLFLAGAFAGLFLLFYGGRCAALASGVATAFAGYYLLYYSMPHLSVETLLPAVLWSTEWLIRRPGIAAFCVLSSFIGMLHLGGMPESAAITVGVATVYLLIRVAMDAPTRVPFARIGIFAGANVLGAGIGAAMLLPFIDYLPSAFDTHRGGGPPVGLGFDGYGAARAVFQRLAPLSYGPPYNSVTDRSFTGYSGLRGWFGTGAAVGASIALLSLFRPTRERTASAHTGAIVALAVLGIGMLAKSVGSPWINWIGWLPALRLIVFPKYGEVVIDVAAALLCGLGIAAFERGRRPEPWVPMTALAAVALGLTLGFRAALAVVPETVHASFLYGSAAFAVVVLTLLGIVLFARPQLTAALFATLVCVEAIANYYVPMYGFVASIPRDAANAWAGAPYVTALHRIDADGRRVLGAGGMLWPEWAGAMRLDDPAALDAMYPSRFLPFVGNFLHPRIPSSRDLLDRFDGSGDSPLTTHDAERWMTLSSLGFVVLPAGADLPDRHFTRVYDADARIYAYDAPLPRASIFHHVRIARNDRAALALLRDPAVDVRDTLILSEPAGAAQTATSNASFSPAEGAHITGRDVTSVDIDATLASPGFVMLNDTELPGWIAAVDGAPAPILHADYLFRAVHVTSGRHHIRFAYRSAADRNGAAITALSVIALALTATFAWLRRRRSFRTAA